MFKNIMVLLFACGILMPSSGYAQDLFFSSIEDMPLMPGLVELPEQTVVFDKPEGRIVESVAQIESVSQGDIQAFYDASLTQFGWKRLGDHTYVRQHEVLELNVEVIDGQEYLRVMVRPREG